MNFLIRILIAALAVAAAAYLLPGVSLEEPKLLYAALTGAVLGLLNAFIKPILRIISLPITILTLGLFALVINVLMVYLADWLLGPRFEVEGFLTALLFSIIVSIVTAVLDRLLDRDRDGNYLERR